MASVKERCVKVKQVENLLAQLSPFQELRVQDSIRLKERFNTLETNPNISASDKEFYKKLIPKVQFSIRGDLITSGLTPRQVEEVLAEKEASQSERNPKIQNVKVIPSV